MLGGMAPRRSWCPLGQALWLPPGAPGSQQVQAGGGLKRAGGARCLGTMGGGAPRPGDSQSP